MSEKVEEKLPPKDFWHRVKTMTWIQFETAECGAVCLGIVLANLRKYVTIEELRKVCAVSRDGMSAHNIIEGAKYYGLEGTGYICKADELYDLDLPAILFWNNDHFVILEGFSKRVVYINDPAKGRRTVSYQTFFQSFSGLAITFEKTDQFAPGGKYPSFTSLLSTWLLHEKPTIAYTLGLGFLLALVNFLLIFFVKIFVDQFFHYNNDSIAYFLIGGLILAACLSGALSAWQSYILDYWGARISIQTSARLLWKMFLLPIGFYTQRFPGEIAYRLNLVDEVAASLSDSLSRIVVSVLLVFLYGLALLFYSWKIFLIILVGSIFQLCWWLYLAARRENAYSCYQAESSKSNSLSIGGLQSIETIKASGFEHNFFASWIELYTKVVNTLQEIDRKDILINLVAPFANSAIMILILLFCSLEIMQGTMSAGTFIVLRMLAGLFMSPLYDLIDYGTTIQLTKADMMRLNDIFENSADPILQSQIDAEASRAENLVKLQGYVDVNGIAFSYSEASPPILSNIYLSLRPGQSMALVGPTGCGKSTLASVIAGLHTATKGEITFDGIPQGKIPRSVIANSVAMVEQEPFLFQGSFKDNLTLFNPAVPESDMIQAVKDACLHQDIVQREKGYELEIEEFGANLSGGQRQRLEIARALLKNPSVLIFDESTSALDSITESEIISNVRKRGCALLMIAHRLSSIKNCDQILVLDQGSIVQSGTHEELSEIPGIYQDLIKSEKPNGIAPIW